MVMQPTKDEARRKWIEAAGILSVDPNAQVPCPNCEEDVLIVADVPYEKDPTMFSRYLRCQRCGAFEVIDRLRRK
jgi:C4-type Zn-finger protein